MAALLSRRPRRFLVRTDRGYMIVLIAGASAVLMLLVAIVVDHSFLRDDRRADQKVADASATAAAVTLASTTSGRDACDRALASAIQNLPGVSSFDGVDCSTIPDFCDGTTDPGTTTGTSGKYTFDFVYPVGDDHDLMDTGSAIGGPARPVTAEDGHRCRRVGVRLALERAPSFGRIVDAPTATTSVHTVALASSETNPDLPINLLILERTACDAIRVEGSGRLIIAPIEGIYPGVLAVESDGTGEFCTDTSPSRGTLNVVSSYVRADGPPGCAAEITAGTGHGCGDITLYAPGVPGPTSPGSCKNEAYRPACTTNSSGSLYPSPQRMGARYTRAAVDHLFNCKTSYESQTWYAEHPVDPCFDALENPHLDYVDEVHDFAGSVGNTPDGFTRYGDDPAECEVSGGGGDVVLPEGNVHVVCPTLFVKKGLTFGGGNVIFDGDVVVEAANGHLTLNACGAEAVDNCNPAEPLVTDPTAPFPWEYGDDFDERQYSSDAAWTLFRNGGTIRKAGGAAVTIHDTVVFIGEDAELNSRALDLEGGSGALRWWGTREGPFKHLSMWSKSEIRHHFAGQASLDLEGVFYAPVALVTYAGSGNQEQVAAQFITERLLVTGTGDLTLAPNLGQGLTHKQARSTLIR